MADGWKGADLHARILDILDEPLDLYDLAAILHEGGHVDDWDYEDLDDLADQLEDYTARIDELWVTPTGLLAADHHLFPGRTFTHRLTEGERASGMIPVNPDLWVLDSDIPMPVPLAGGGELDIGFEETDEGAGAGAVLGPPGWLDGFAAGDLLAFSFGRDGIAVARVDTVGDGAREAEMLRLALAARIESKEHGEAAFAVLLDVLAHHGDAFREPVRPLGELFADGGIEVRGEWVGTAGSDWAPPMVTDAEMDRLRIADRYEFNRCCLDAFDAVMDAWNALVVPEGEGIDWRDVAELLRHGEVAPGFADFVLRDLDEGHPVLDEFVSALRTAGRRADGPASYLAARNLERAGDVLAAETLLQSAFRADPSFGPTLVELAWYVADRGDAEQAARLLRRSGIEADSLELELLESMRPSRKAVGRNERCPCGSGRKFKDCCQRADRAPLVQRGDWLVHKLWTFVLRPQHLRHVMLVMLELTRGDDDAVDELLDLGLPMDLAAFDGGLAEVFLAQRGRLLPDDERDVLEGWIREPRALWEVVEHRPGEYLGLRDTTRDRTVVIAAPPRSELELGGLVYARVGAIGDRYRFVGVPLDLPPEARGSVEALIASEPDALKIARWFSELVP
jgi:hypothetical protein